MVNEKSIFPFLLKAFRKADCFDCPDVGGGVFPTLRCETVQRAVKNGY